jgi:hypothetical protein
MMFIPHRKYAYGFPRPAKGIALLISLLHYSTIPLFHYSTTPLSYSSAQFLLHELPIILIVYGEA